MAKRVMEIKVGIFILIPLVILISFVVLKMGYSFASSTIDVYLKIDNIKMIKEGTLVKVKGYEIGRVVAIQPVYQPELHFLAVMRIQNKIAISEDCVAVIQNQNVIGDSIVELRNPERKGALIRNGDVLEAVEYVSIEALLNDVHGLLSSITETVNLFKLISNENKGDIRRTLADLSGTVAGLNRMVGDSQSDVLETMSSLRKTSESMNQIANELKKHPLKFLMKE